MNPLHEQNNGTILLDGGCRPLPMLEAWRGSSAVYWIAPDAPYAAMSFKVAKPDESSFYESVAMQLHPRRGMWRAYIPGTMFGQRCETRYKVTAIDAEGFRHVCGEGILRVFSGAVYDREEGFDPASQCYARFPDGRWRRVGVFTDATGELAFSVDQEPTPDIPDAPFGTPYALCTADGMYYALTGFVDETGEAFLSVADKGTDGKSQTFAMDDASGFYYRIETLRDEVGEMTLKVGEMMK